MEAETPQIIDLTAERGARAARPWDRLHHPATRPGTLSMAEALAVMKSLRVAAHPMRPMPVREVGQ